MNAEERRTMILNKLIDSESPLSGSKLAQLFNVSRQVIVQDIALLRANDHEIISTNSGYLIKTPTRPEKVFCVSHKDEHILDELFTIVDLGGQISDVRIQHKVYGNISAPLNIKSRKDARKFVEDITAGASVPLKNLTRDDHCHLVTADCNDDLDQIESELRKKGYLRDVSKTASDQ